MKTGEGKSIILGILVAYFTFKGYNVNFVCYSPYLSERDFKSFENLFKELEIEDKIKY